MDYRFLWGRTIMPGMEKLEKELFFQKKNVFPFDPTVGRKDSSSEENSFFHSTFSGYIFLSSHFSEISL